MSAVVVDLEVVDSLDIAFNNFSLVGGEKAFVNECGGTAKCNVGLLQSKKCVDVSVFYCSTLRICMQLLYITKWRQCYYHSDSRLNSGDWFGIISI